MKALVIGGTGPSGPPVVRGLMDRGYELTLYHRGYHEPADLPKVDRHVHGDPYSKDALTNDFGTETFDLVLCTYGRLRYAADVFANRTPKFVGAGGLPALIQAEHLPFPQGLEIPLNDSHPTYSRPEHRELNRYGSAVAYTERQVMQHHWNGDFKATMFRYSSIYGPWGARHWIGSVVKRVLDGRKQIIVPGDGTRLRQACFADNAAHQLLLGCTRPEADGEIFETVDDHSFTVADSIRLVAQALGHEFELVRINHPLAYKLSGGSGGYGPYMLSTHKLRTLLGYRDVVPAEEGIQRTARWMRDNAQYVDWNQMVQLGGDPLAYDLEDQLIAMAKEWDKLVTKTVPQPKAIVPPEGDWREAFDPVHQGDILVDANWLPQRVQARAQERSARPPSS